MTILCCHSTSIFSSEVWKNMTGYSLSKADRAKIDPKNLCTKCTNLLREATQTITCGHRYCKLCIDSILSQEVSACVADGAVLIRDEVFRDKFVEREILSLVLQCVNSDKGCQWRGELKHREVHVISCEFGEVPCVIPECGTLIQRSELANHLQNTCNYRQETCSFCQEMVVIATMTQHHQTSCPKYPETCPECGKADIPRCKLPFHLDSTTGDCKEVKALCPFEGIGCKTTKVMALNERMEHFKEDVTTHLHLLLKHVKELPRISTTGHPPANGFTLISIETQVQQAVEQIGAGLAEMRALSFRVDMNESCIKDLEAKDQQLTMQPCVCMMAERNTADKGTLNELLRRVHNQEAKSADLEVFVVEGNRRDDDLERQVIALKNEQEQLKDTIRKLQRQNDSLEHTLGVRNMALADLEEYITQQENSSCDGTLIWKITDFSRKKQDSLTGRQVSVYSPCFYTSRYGYKMCARIYLNGDGMGRGTHISVFFALMRGQHDALLRWPFRQKVTMMLLDQNNAEHVIDAFRPDPNSSSFQRPRREMNVASGCPLFCPLSELNNHAYVRDDAMFLKIIVDVSDL